MYKIIYLNIHNSFNHRNIKKIYKTHYGFLEIYYLMLRESLNPSFGTYS